MRLGRDLFRRRAIDESREADAHRRRKLAVHHPDRIGGVKRLGIVVRQIRVLPIAETALTQQALDRVERAVPIAGASHVGFDDHATGLRGVLANPDVITCWVLRRVLHLDAAVERVRALTRPEEGVDLAEIRPPCLDAPPPVAMDPARQHMLTTLAVAAFLESRFADDPAARASADRYLTVTMPRELDEVSVATAAPTC